MTTRYEATIDSDNARITYSFSTESDELVLSFAFSRGWVPMRVSLHATREQRAEIAAALRAVAHGLESDAASVPAQQTLLGFE